MTVKDLKEKLAMLPEDAKVLVDTRGTNNLKKDFYIAGELIYTEIIEKGGIKAVFINR